LLVYLEPAYRVSSQIAVGLRIESAIMARGIATASGNADFSAYGNFSYTINGQYYLSNNTFRPFIGVGVGLFGLASVRTDNVDLVSAGTKFGFYPRIGFEADYFAFNFEYNLIPATKIDGTDISIKNSYAGIKLGFFLFGRRN
jgi:outer membrane protein W